MPDHSNMISAVKDFITGLTLRGVVLSLLLAGGGVMLYGVWEDRSRWSGLAWSSPWLLVAVASGVALTAVGWIVSAQQRRLMEVQDELVAQLRSQTSDMQAALRLATQEMADMRTQILVLREQEMRCQERLRDFERRLTIPDRRER